VFELAIALCHFVSPSSTELGCTTLRTTTDNCVTTLEQLKEDYMGTDQFIKMAMCIKKPKRKSSDYPKIKKLT